MEQNTLIFYVVVCLATLTLILFAHQLCRSTKFNLPPGPTPLPIIGNLNLVGSLYDPRFMQELSKKYGEIMHFKFGSKHIVIASSVDMAKIFLKTMDANFACRPKTMIGKYTSYNYTGILLSPYGPYFTQARKVCTVELFSTQRLDSHEHVRMEEMKLLLKEIYSLSGEEIVLKDVLSTLSLNVVSRIVLGKKYFDKSEAIGEEFRKTLDELLLVGEELNIGDWIPWIGFLDLQGHVKRTKEVSKKLDRFLEHVLDDHDARRKEKGENFVPSDMVDVLLQNVDDPTQNVKLERHGVKAIIQDLVVGGIEGSAVTVDLAISYLLKNPKILENAIEELDRVIGGNGWVEEKDISYLSYITAIAKETLRLHPTSPMLIPRRARNDCKVAGYDILKDTQVMVNVWAIGRDPRLWDKPEEFCPERYIGKEVDVKGANFELLPFGAGRRMCLGCNLGLKLIESSLANLLHGFNWKLSDKMTRQNSHTQEIFSLSTSPLVTIAHPRLLPEMYYQ